MDTQQQSLHQELAYLRSLAESGKSAPLQLGPYLVAGGGWFAAASLLLALAQLGVLPLTDAHIGTVFVLATAGFAITLAVLIRRDRRQPEQGRNRIINAAWSGAGFTIFAFWIAVTLLAVRGDNGAVMQTMSLAVLGVYGLVWWITSVVAEAEWMRRITWLSFASMLVVAWCATTSFGWLAYTLALVLSALVPGIWILRSAARSE